MTRIQSLRALIVLIVLGLIVTRGGVRAQTTPGTIQFEVTSVRASADHGRTAINMPLRTLIRNAFGLQFEEQLADGPEGVSDARFDISARAEAARPSIDHIELPTLD